MTLYLIVCATGPAPGAGELVTLSQRAGWDVQVVATPLALDFLDLAAIEEQTGRPVRSRYRLPSEPKPPRPEAIIVAPASYNTINKFALGIADTYPLGLLAEAPGLGIPVVILPSVNPSLAGRVPYQASVARLRAEGVELLDPPPAGAFPWHTALEALSRRLP
ncbi:putative flavoprotein [Actinoplanes missouriensis 431]|uniref:Putative flavoprotein n=1 Tax=Actinoplanes missouriensis (strain ATCC 14538 / DSM 43046 / CBS 188.64 / JCM 3121 / NBRC 102363 / NCIMB 12654 / NRRL B-3342 / UNCC 431) TaxID=512565 RepID=I0HE58_ACTM4|nr:flavoprotein [Actinoplanes missouriensis]BAL91295.1 putative flavoprotein [Actinoplanes missouriensis 431]